MKVIETTISDVIIFELPRFEDHRGYFVEVFRKQKFIELGIDTEFVQDNHSYTARKGTLRGLHFQCEPMAQAKLVRVTRGCVLDVAVDLRIGSPTFGKWAGTELSESNQRIVFIPRGFAHGFLTLTDNVDFTYKVDNYYSREHGRSLAFNDPDIKIEWGIQTPILSDQDKAAPLLKSLDCNFYYVKRDQP